MKFKLYREYGALNSPNVFDALQKGIMKLGHQEVTHNEDVSVIWSVLWHGRMLNNQTIYQQNLKEGKRTLILEVGNLKRGETWRLSLDHVNRFGIFGNKMNLDATRPKKLGLNLKAEQKNRSNAILIACQHDKSLQWQGQPPMHQWVNQTIASIRRHTTRKIVVRPHPRCLLKSAILECDVELPKKVNGTYDDFDIDYNYHCVINHNSGPCIQSAIHGVPIICDQSSLAWDVSDQIENIENIQLKDREKWLVRLSHTEWTREEIATGEPLNRILQEIIA